MIAGLVIIGIIVGVFVLAYFSIGMLAKKALPKITAYKNKLDDKIEQKTNPYVQYHKFAKMDNDRHYESYLKWCADNEQIPMDKEVFLIGIENKEKYLEDIISKLI